MPIFHSRDLVSWTQIGHVLTRERQLNLAGVYSSGGIYAPTLRHHAGRFYMITTLVGSPKRSGNFYVTADDPRGPWSDPIWLDHGEHGLRSVAAVRRRRGRTTCATARARRTDHPRVYQARIDPATGALREPMQVIWEGTGGIWPEGAHVYKMKGRYYLFAAEGGTEYGHAEVVGRGASPFGPFEPFPGNPILTHRDPARARDPGDRPRRSRRARRRHDLGGVPRASRPQGGRFHHLGRETFLAPVRFSADGWPTIGDGGRVELRMPAPRAAAAPAAARSRRATTSIARRWRSRGTSSATRTPATSRWPRAPASCA